MYILPLLYSLGYSMNSLSSSPTLDGNNPNPPPNLVKTSPRLRVSHICTRPAIKMSVFKYTYYSYVYAGRQTKIIKIKGNESECLGPLKIEE